MGFVTQFQQRRAHGVLRRLRGRRRLRAVGQQHGGDAIRCSSVACWRPSRQRSRTSASSTSRPCASTATTDHADMVHVAFKPRDRPRPRQRESCICSSQNEEDRRRVHRARIAFSGVGSRTSRRSATAATGENAERYTFKDQPKRVGRYEEMRAFPRRLHAEERRREITGMPGAVRSEMLADIYGDNRDRGTVSLWCMGVNQHVPRHVDEQPHQRPAPRHRQDRRGRARIPFSLTGQPSACGTAREVGTLSNRLPADMVVMNRRSIVRRPRRSGGSSRARSTPNRATTRWTCSARSRERT